jgi:PAS domain S-box-containing protein
MNAPVPPGSRLPPPTPELLQLTLEHLEEIVYAVRFDGTDYRRGEATYVSPRVAELVGFSADDFARDPTLWFNRIHPDDVASVKASTRAILASGRSGLRTYRVKRLQGDYRWFEDRVVPQLNERNEVIGVFGLARDVTERHNSAQQLEEAEGRLRELIESIPDGLVVIDADSQIVLVNREAEEMFGYTREEMIGLPIERLVPERFTRTHTTAREQFMRAPRQRPMGTGLDLVAAHKDLSEFPVEISLSPFRAGTQSFVNVTIRDIRERQELERQLRQSQKMEAVGRLAGGLAHDFNNLLTVIEGYTDALFDRVELNESRGDLLEIKAAAHRASALTRQLLAYGRRQVRHLAVVDLNAVVDSTGSMLRRVIGEHVALTVSLAPDLQPVRVDTHQMEQVVVNLVLNARDAMPDGGVLTIVTKNVHLDTDVGVGRGTVPPGEYVALIVTDTGHGMGPEVLAHAFDPFFTTKGPGVGSGLGLSVVDGIVSQSGGRTSIRSEPGRGCTVTVCLPAVAEAVARETDHHVPARGQATATAATVLLVEDESGVRELMRRILTRAGYHVLTARDGEEGVRASAEHRATIDLLVTDVIMPIMGGRALAEKLREARPELRVLFVSGYSAAALPLFERDGEKVTLLEKPFTSAKFIDAVRLLLEPALDGPSTKP